MKKERRGKTKNLPRKEKKALCLVIFDRLICLSYHHVSLIFTYKRLHKKNVFSSGKNVLNRHLSFLLKLEEILHLEFSFTFCDNNKIENKNDANNDNEDHDDILNIHSK